MEWAEHAITRLLNAILMLLWVTGVKVIAGDCFPMMHSWVGRSGNDKNISRSEINGRFPRTVVTGTKTRLTPPSTGMGRVALQIGGAGESARAQ